MKAIVLQFSNHRLQCDSRLDGKSDTYRPKVVAVARSVVGRAAVGDFTGSLTNCLEGV